MRFLSIAVLVIGCAQGELHTVTLPSASPTSAAPRPVATASAADVIPSPSPTRIPPLTMTPTSPDPPVGELIPLWTADAPPPTSPTSGHSMCDLGHVGGYLHPHPESGLGLRDRRGRRVFPVIWLFGSTARATPDGDILLIGPGGDVSARQGDRIEAAGGVNAEGVAYICSP